MTTSESGSFAISDGRRLRRRVAPRADTLGRSIHLLFAFSLCVGLVSCSQEAVHVADTSLAEDEATFTFLGDAKGAQPAVFSTEDEKVTLSVRFSYNLVATFFLYQVRWIAPNDSLYLRGQIRTEFGTHRELTTEMRVRGEAPSQMPGQWRVQLYLDERLLTERSFTIEAPPALCPPAHLPAGHCVDKLRFE